MTGILRVNPSQKNHLTFPPSDGRIPGRVSLARPRQTYRLRGVMKREELRYLLINVPLTDPTASYHSIPYLVGATSNAGFHGWRCLDANIEALNCLANPEHVATALQQAAEARQTLEGRER